MNNWCLHERTQLRAEGREWRLCPEKDLLVGTSSECGVVIQSSQTVDSQHAVLKWDQRNLSYIVKDLNSVNGTYVNNHPLRGTSVLLRHNDAIRFGLDKDHVFRMVECFSTPKDPIAEPAIAARVSMSVSMSPHPQAAVTPSSPSHSSAAAATVVTDTAQMHSQQDGIPMSTQPVAPPTATPHAMPPNSLAVASGSPTHSPSHTPHRHTDSRSMIPHALPISPTNGEDSSLHRSDGRRSVDTENTPALNRASKLYGQPDWWGEGVGGDVTEARNREFEFAKPGSQILRKLDPEPKKNSSAPKLQHKADELRMQAISNSHLDPTASWVIEFGNGAGTGTPPKMRRPRERGSRPRSADPSPNRLSVRRDPSPLTKRAVTPTYKRHSSVSSSSSQASTAPVMRKRASTPPVSRPKGASSKKPPYGINSSPKRKSLGKLLTTSPQSAPPHSKTPQSRTPNSATAPSTPQSKPPQSEILSTEPPKSESQSLLSIPNPKDTNIDLKSLNEGSLSHLVKAEEDTYTAGVASSDDSSVSSLSDQYSPSEKHPVVVTAAAGRGDGKVGVEVVSSSRKQWVEEEAKPTPDSLMMASIEARMRRLSKITHQTARQVTALKNSIQDGHQMEVKGMKYLSLRDTSPVVTRPEHNLPEWKFFNQEANSIFRNMRVVEKWLQDIEGTLNSIQPVDQNTTSGEEYVDLASDGELYLDTIDAFESASEGD